MFSSRHLFQFKNGFTVRQVHSGHGSTPCHRPGMCQMCCFSGSQKARSASVWIPSPVSPFALWLCPHHWAGPGSCLRSLGLEPGQTHHEGSGIQTDSWACALFFNLRNAACRIAGGMFLVSAKLTTVTLLSPIIKVARKPPLKPLPASSRTPAIKLGVWPPGCDHSPGPG